MLPFLHHIKQVHFTNKHYSPVNIRESKMDRWVGKVAIITGASAGIGADIAKTLVEKGVKVVGLARRKDRIEELAKKLGCQKGKLYAVKCDVTKEEEILNAFKWTTENVGLVHILINNAGIFQHSNLIDGDASKWRKIFDVNVLGLSIATREAVRIMKANNIQGHIIHINSVAGHRVVYFPDVNVYSASKFAVTALTETLRREFIANRLKIKITSISPGGVATELGNNAEFSFDENTRKAFSGLKFLDPQDVTEAVVYVLSTKPHVQVHELTVQPMDEPF